MLDICHRSDGEAEVLVHWKGLPDCENSWELLMVLQQLFPDAHLEDKVLLLVFFFGGGGDWFCGRVYNRRNKKVELGEEQAQLCN